MEIAPVLCAGVTVYKGLKVTDTRPGDWVAISGIGGLGHMAVQYARAMGLNVAAVDVDDNKLALARQLGAQVTVNARTTDPAAFLKKEIGGAHGALVTAVSPKAFEQALGMVRRGGTVSLNGLPPGNFPLDIFGMVLNGITCAARSSAPAWTCRNRCSSLPRARSPPPSAPIAWKTSTMCSHACTRAPSKAASYWTSPPDPPCMAAAARPLSHGRGAMPIHRQRALARPYNACMPGVLKILFLSIVALLGGVLSLALVSSVASWLPPLLGMPPDNNSAQLGWDLAFSVLGGIAGIALPPTTRPAGRVRTASRSGRWSRWAVATPCGRRVRISALVRHFAAGVAAAAIAGRLVVWPSLARCKVMPPVEPSPCSAFMHIYTGSRA